MILKHIKPFLLALTLIAFLSSCNDDDNTVTATDDVDDTMDDGIDDDGGVVLDFSGT